MASDISLFNSAGLTPEKISKYKEALDRVDAEAPAAGGLPYLRCNKEGIWNYGSDLTEVEPGSLWAANPLSFEKGYICWRKGAKTPLGKSMRNVFSDEPPISGDNLPALEGEWSKNVMCELTCISGEDKGTLVQFTSNSMGGVERWHDLVRALRAQFDKDPSKLVPIISLEHDGYFHPDTSFGVRHPETKQAGWIVKPVFKVVEWRAMTDVSATAAIESKPAPAPAPEPQRRRRRAAASA